MKTTYIATSVDAANRYVRFYDDIPTIPPDGTPVRIKSTVTGYKMALDADSLTYDSFFQKTGCREWEPISNGKKLSSLDKLNRDIEAGHLVEA